MRRRMILGVMAVNALFTLGAGCASAPEYTMEDVRPKTYTEALSGRWPTGCLPLREDRVKREEDRGKCVVFGPPVAAPGMMCVNWGIISTCQ